MRLWSLHPRHLDTRALVACWREGLLAYHVLRGMTKWYTNHPQLIRFRATSNPIESMEMYLHGICDEADIRGYRFDRTKLETWEYGLSRTSQWQIQEILEIPLTRGQLEYETAHLRKKILERAPKELYRLEWNIIPHSIFTLGEWAIESWEKVI